MEMINKTHKNVEELNDNDWSEIAQKLSLTPQQTYWKAKRLQKDLKDQAPNDIKASKKEMITKALAELPEQRGSKKDIFTMIE